MTPKPTAVVVRLPITDEQAQEMYAAYCAAYVSSSLTTRGTATQAAIFAIGTPVTGGDLKIWGNVSRENAKDLGPEQAVLMFGGADTGPDDINLVDAEDAQAALAAAQAEIVRLKEAAQHSKREQFNAGYLLACCNISNMHNEESIASDILAEAGITEEEVKSLDLSEYDATALVKIREARNTDPILKDPAA